jgi:hypothetical protein
LKLKIEMSNDAEIELDVERMTMKEVFQTSFNFNSTEQILLHRFAGNHACDHQAFMAIDRYLTSGRCSMEDARKIMDHVCVAGMGIDPISDAELTQHLQELRALRR